MAKVRLTRDTPEGAPGCVVWVSRSRAADLVNAGWAQRILDGDAARPGRVADIPRPPKRDRRAR